MPISASEKVDPDGGAPKRCTCPRCRAHDAGFSGPYTAQDWVRLFGVVNEPEPVEVAPELAALGVEVDAATEAWEHAKAAYQGACRAVARLERRGYGLDDDGNVIIVGPTPSRDDSQLVAARAERDEARAEMDEAGRQLEDARAAYNDMARRLQDRRAAEVYAADVAAQEAQREAQRAAANERRSHRSLRAIRSRLQGGQ